MLLPSALSCESRQPPARSRFPSTRLFPATPPPCDDGFIAGNGLLGTCRSLQSLLNVSPASSPRRSKPDRLQSPLQIRANTMTRVAKPIAKPPRGVNKRRRDVYEDDSDDYGDGDDDDQVSGGRITSADRFSTPKRRRRAPPEIPLGLDSSDFKALDSLSDSSATLSLSPRQLKDRLGGESRHFDSDPATPSSRDDASKLPVDSSSDWTSEDDGRLVELVLEKLKLSKRDWTDCARRMGKDNDSVGRRWKALVGEGNVGLRRGKRMVRARIHESWR
ncbi:hypothetical protein CPC735_027180 [Coccidioides posadasii C735 delta SOWgp]|uniref:Myb-like domain-containing protein n=2 Tax=Coccidioides posadasii TaxID=199306 RepID=A0A0J6F2S5_COCPO|nr:hypothetical protein CPC735_027180 [Coccidioides posadasii C735 delta SOWgp]EER27382.1 hypothetical protein CPC735_027180 [Coccidioides posadasii C735 delta SOWgp]KMM67186.1 hypothetical protein CPAG_03521 [Coccidioides posadasii RMSCC 3488]|eukprot:XP_003069527.1 hypothetical protein CPC735_027180 [Coccidioides posadasii C735 delta SOWgp]